MKKKLKVKIQPTVYINGRGYKTARKACLAWAEGVYCRMYERHTKKIGYAAYYDKAWCERNEYDNNSKTNTCGGVVYYADPRKAVDKAFRRSINIFNEIFDQRNP
jgi:hypothetical protein